MQVGQAGEVTHVGAYAQLDPTESRTPGLEADILEAGMQALSTRYAFSWDAICVEINLLWIPRKVLRGHPHAAVVASSRSWVSLHPLPRRDFELLSKLPAGTSFLLLSPAR